MNCQLIKLNFFIPKVSGERGAFKNYNGEKFAEVLLKASLQVI
ncbi:hypothetical protein ACFPTR_09690 [Aliibacillus thermotolerans]|uniref:Uncharacterized protein n=1 Tax=Aliibacillus thermotolerans TaxID=1834418 RepID=A0ABW0U8L3_9BACI|nr:hypothetical protein [Aliibacillus thermotolerans]